MSNDLVVGSIRQLTTQQDPRKLYPTIQMEPRLPEIPPPVVYVWSVDFFGDGKSLVFPTNVDKRWVRFWTRVFFRTRWSRF